jgi:hypothetical protein
MQADEALVDRIDLLRRPKPGRQGHHAVAHVAVEHKVGRQRHQPSRLFQMTDLEPGRGHLDAQVLGLVAARDGATIVVRQDHHRTPVQAGPEHPFAGDIKVVAVDQRVHGGIPRIG